MKPGRSSCDEGFGRPQDGAASPAAPPVGGACIYEGLLGHSVGGAQTAAIDCILGQDSPVTLQGQDPPLVTVFQWADLGPEPSRLR